MSSAAAAAVAAVRAGARGAVMIEFLIAFVPVLVLFLGAVQLALVSAAQLVVQHAAFCGARSAAVVLDDDPRFYDGAARGELWAGPTDPRDGPRLAAIRRAVHAPLAALPRDPAVPVRTATAIVFPLEPGGTLVARERFELTDRVTLRVSYALPCAVPIAARWVCSRPEPRLPWLAKLEAEATLPLQRAPYAYASERPDERGAP